MVRYAGTALLCVVAAFGAAFLIRHAVDHGATARATVAADARTSPLRPSPTTTSARRTHAQNPAAAHHRSRTPQLAAEFAPGVQTITRQKPKPKPKPKHRKRHTASRSSGTSTPTEPTATISEPTYTTPVPEPAPTTGGSSSGSGSSGATHKSPGSGTGTTSIGSSGKGSGTTTIG